MNPKQSSTRSDRKHCHDQDSFQRRTKKHTRRLSDPRNVPELRDFPDISEESGNREDEHSTPVEKSDEVRISQLSGDAWYEKSWQSFDDSDATTTMPGLGGRTKKRAR